MKSFTSHIYGNVPVYVEIDKSGTIESIGVLAKQETQKVLYWFDFDIEQRVKLEHEFFDQIEQCLTT